MSDAAIERIPQQVLGLLHCEEDPRFVVYSYGQALKPAPQSIQTGGRFMGLVTNYQVTAETVTRPWCGWTACRTSAGVGGVVQSVGAGLGGGEGYIT
jgi:hypothetical protein